MLSVPGYYDVLQVADDSPVEEIKSAFRRLALIHHPDKNSNSPESQARFILISNAYNVLVDPQKRKKYDDYLRNRDSLHVRMNKNTVVRAALPGNTGDIYGSNRDLLNHFNFLLWDIEDFVRDMDGPGSARKYNGTPPVQYVLKILAFIDKWVLVPSGYPDYFMDARRMKRIDPDDHINNIGTSMDRYGHYPFVNVKDYFYDIRKRIDKLILKINVNDLIMEVPGCGVTLVDCIVEAQNFIVHYLGFLLRAKSGEAISIPEFEHSKECFMN